MNWHLLLSRWSSPWWKEPEKACHRLRHDQNASQKLLTSVHGNRSSLMHFRMGLQQSAPYAAEPLGIYHKKEDGNTVPGFIPATISPVGKRSP